MLVVKHIAIPTNLTKDGSFREVCELYKPLLSKIGHKKTGNK